MGIASSDCKQYCREVDQIMTTLGKTEDENGLVSAYKVSTPQPEVRCNRSSLFQPCYCVRTRGAYDKMRRDYRKSQTNLVNVLYNDFWNHVSNEDISVDQQNSDRNTTGFLKMADGIDWPRAVYLYYNIQGKEY